MSESFQRFTNNALRRSFERPAQEVFQKEGWQGIARRAFEAARTKPHYLQEGGPYFAEMRHRLNTEPGLMIANHPGNLDGLLLINTLQRYDVKMMVSENAIDSYERVLGKGFVLPASHSITELKQIFQEIEAHIRSGGLFLFFPTGGDRPDESFEFQGLFRVLRRRLLPSDMIYTLAIDPHYPEYTNLYSPSKRIQVASDLLLPDSFPRFRPSSPPTPIPVDECYTQAHEWQDKRGNIELTQHYRELFPEFF